MTSHLKNNSGFTIIEFLIAIVLLGIITSLAVPAFVNMSDVFGVDAKQRSLIGAIKYAQSEAIKQNSTVSACVAHASSANTCSTVAAETWTQGWHVFIDENNNRAVDGAANILRSQAPVANVSIVSVPPDQNAITFDGSGALAFGAGVAFNICDKKTNNLDCSDSSEYTNGFASLVSGQIVSRN
ncbi:MAG: GspH/FimT family pseudopilin [Acidiferrobacterales bacterium]|nr:GspH/FimT family pseudopilin [Acidiferrobacterales bacterium]